MGIDGILRKFHIMCLQFSSNPSNSGDGAHILPGMESDSPETDLIRRRLLRTLGLSTLAITVPLLAPKYSWAAPLGHNPKTGMAPMAPVGPPRLLMIDPGHGGRDPGAIGKSGTYEKDVVLDICRELADQISRVPGVQAKLTRDTDEFIPLSERVRIAQEAHGDFLVSIHADSAPESSARGLSCYTLSKKASDDFSQALEKKENLADFMGGLKVPSSDPAVTDILMELAARHTKTASLKARQELVKGVKGDWTLLENPMRSANFAVLRAPDIPSMLIETGFLSNPQDEQILASRQNRQHIAKLLGREFTDILSSPPFV